MSTSTESAAPAALPDTKGTPDQTGTSVALILRPTTNGGRTNGPQADGDHANGHPPKMANTHAKWQIVMLPVEGIDPNPWQPRTLFDPDEMEELTASVKTHGVQQPILVRTAKALPVEEDGAAKSRSKKAPVRYQLVAGERRVRACVSAGRRTIPAIMRDDLSDLQVAEMALLENVQRSNLSAIEEAKGYRRLMLDFKLSEERLAKKVGKSVAVLREMMKLLALPEGVQQLIRLKKLTPAHGHELLRLTASTEVCQNVAAYAVSTHLPATALAKDPLPTSRELEKRGLIVTLDYRTRFDKSVCKVCPHKAHIASGYAAYCLKPNEWKRKQEETLEREKDENARALEEARRQSEARTANQDSQEQTQENEEEGNENGSPIPLLNQLPRNSYRDLRFGDLPSGCSSSCSCRGCALDPYVVREAGTEGQEKGEERGARIAICLDPARYNELQREERARRDEEKRRHFTGKFERALHDLHVAWEEGRCAQAVALAFTPFLEGHCSRGTYLSPTQWEEILERVAKRLGMELPFYRLFAEEADDAYILRALSGQDREDGGESEEEIEKSFEPLQLVLLGAGVLLALEAESAIKYSGETPMLDFILPPADQSQITLELGESADADDEEEEQPLDHDWEPDPFMEEDFATAVSQTDDDDHPQMVALAAAHGDEDAV